MAGKARVSALAKELGVTSKELLSALQSMGEYVKSASSTIEAPVEQRLRASYPANGASIAVTIAADALIARVENLARWTDVSQVIRACRQAQREQRPLVLDMRSAAYSYPNTCVPIAAIVQHYRSLGVHITAVNQPARVHNTNLMSPVEATEENLLQHGKIVNTVWAYFDTTQATALTDAVVKHMEKTIPMEVGVQQSLNICLFEIIDNVFEHSEQNSGFFMTTLGGRATRLAMSICDVGVGALNSFRGSQHHPSNDFDALTLTVQAGVTSTGDTPRGNGLYSLLRTVQTNQGRLELRSGTGQLLITDNSITGGDHVSQPTIGTQNRGFFVDWQLDLSRPINLSDVYDDLPCVPVNHQLELIENDRAEHVVLIRDHETGLGTRKAAEQLRVYLLNLLAMGASKLVLDFAGVAVVGVSFADEVIGKLAEQFGVIGFMQTFELRNTESTVQLLLNRAISLRLGAIRPDAITRES